MPSKNDFDDDVDLREKLLDLESPQERPVLPSYISKSTRAVSLSSDEDSVHSDIIWISSKPGFSGAAMKNKPSFSLGNCLCKFVLIVTLVLTALVVITTGFAYLWVKDVVQHLTIQEHRSFPVVEMSDVELDLLKDRVKLFVDELRRGDSSIPLEELVITQDEINGFLGHSDFLRGNMQVTLQENSIVEEYSLPMDLFPGGKGRYFDAHEYTKVDPAHHRMELKMETKALHKDWFVGPLYFLQLSYKTDDANEYHQHLLQLFLEQGTIFGNAIPDDIIEQHHNLLEDAYADPDSGFDVRAVVNGIEGVSIQNGQIVIMPRRRVPDEEKIDPFPAYPFPNESASDDEPVYIELEAEAVAEETETEPITVEFIPLEELPESEDDIDREVTNAAKMEAMAKNQASGSTFRRAHKVRAAAPAKASVATTNNIHSKSNP